MPDITAQDFNNQLDRKKVIDFVTDNSPTDAEEIMQNFPVFKDLESTQLYIEGLIKDDLIGVDQSDSSYPVYIGADEN